MFHIPTVYKHTLSFSVSLPVSVFLSVSLAEAGGKLEIGSRENFSKVRSSLILSVSAILLFSSYGWKTFRDGVAGV